MSLRAENDAIASQHSVSDPRNGSHKKWSEAIQRLTFKDKNPDLASIAKKCPDHFSKLCFYMQSLYQNGSKNSLD